FAPLCRRSSATWRPDAHSGADLGDRLRRDRPGALGALGERALERFLVGPQLFVALADGTQEVDDRLRDRLLERAVALAVELALDRRVIDAADDRDDLDQVRDRALVRPCPARASRSGHGAFV